MKSLQENKFNVLYSHILRLLRRKSYDIFPSDIFNIFNEKHSKIVKWFFLQNFLSLDLDLILYHFIYS